MPLVPGDVWIDTTAGDDKMYTWNGSAFTPAVGDKLDDTPDTIISRLNDGTTLINGPRIDTNTLVVKNVLIGSSFQVDLSETGLVIDASLDGRSYQSGNVAFRDGEIVRLELGTLGSGAQISLSGAKLVGLFGAYVGGDQPVRFENMLGVVAGIRGGGGVDVAGQSYLEHLEIQSTLRVGNDDVYHEGNLAGGTDIQISGGVINYVGSAGSGDITAVNAGTGISGGGTSGSVTVHLSITELLTGNVDDSDLLVYSTSSGTLRKVEVRNLFDALPIATPATGDDLIVRDFSDGFLKRMDVERFAWWTGSRYDFSQNTEAANFLVTPVITGWMPVKLEDGGTAYVPAYVE